METVHGPKLAALVGELLQPLDLGKKENTCRGRYELTVLFMFSFKNAIFPRTFENIFL